MIEIGETARDNKTRSRSHYSGLTPLRSVEEDRIKTYAGYHDRMCSKKLRAALCRIETVDGREALCLDPACAPVTNSEEFEPEFGNGVTISAERAAALRRRIAKSGLPVVSEACL